MKDEQDFLTALKNGTLPSVSFVKQLGAENEHPGYANETTGEQSAASMVKAVQDSPYWKDAAIVITYDENGGRWDHVAPPSGDRWGPATRVPALEQFRWAVFCAASVEYLCHKYQILCPVWALSPHYTLSDPWYHGIGADLPKVQEKLRTTTPEEFSRRNIFCGDRTYRNKYEYEGRQQYQRTA